MYSILTILLLLSVGWNITPIEHSFDIKNQNSNKLDDFLPFGDEGSQNRLTQYEKQGSCWNLLGYEKENYNWTDSIASTVRYSYTYDENNNMIESLTQGYQDPVWVNSKKTTYTYDENNNLIESLRQSYQDSVLNFTGKITYTYDENNNLIEEISRIMYSLISTWQIIHMNTYTYDNKNNLKKHYEVTFSPYLFLVEGYSYDENNNMIEYIRDEKWQGGSYVSKETYTYNENNLLIEMIYYDDYDFVSGWGGSYNATYTYDENNNLIEVILHDWSEIDGDQKITYTYNENNIRIERLTYWWINDEEGWGVAPGLGFFWIYDDNGNLIQTKQQRSGRDEVVWTSTYDNNNNRSEYKYQYLSNNNPLELKVNWREYNYIYETCNELSIDEDLVPHQYNIINIYPNPFNPTTTISFSIPEFGLTNITAYDIIGRELETLTNEVLSIGNYSIKWNASSYPSGVYLIRMDSGEFTKTQKVVLIK